MLAFEISINGNPLYTIGAGNVHHLQAVVMCSRLTGEDGILQENVIFAGAAASKSYKICNPQPYEPLAIGDEITVRLVDTGAVWIPDDIPKKPTFQPPSTDEPFRLFPD